MPADIQTIQLLVSTAGGFYSLSTGELISMLTFVSLRLLSWSII